jgi:uncharacterized protein (DUF1015 family)
MIEIKPFRGVTYNKNKIDDFDLVTAPPYDVISPRERDDLYKKNKYNIVRLILGKEYSTDNKRNNRYSRAANFIEKWMQEKVLVRDEKPCLYVYLQEFKDLQTKKKIKRLGFIACFKLQEFSKKNIFPHELTLSKPKADRFKLIKSTSSNYSPVFSLYSDKKKKVDSILKKALKKKPFLKVRDENATLHKLYKISDKKIISQIVKGLKNKKLFIADGHHRYETALNYKKHIAKGGKRFVDVEASSTLMYFTNLNSTGLKIYPIHRALRNLSEKAIENLIDKLSAFFTIKKAASKNEMLKIVLSSRPKEYIFGLYFHKDFYILRLKDKNLPAKAAGMKKASKVDKLNVSLLHNLVIDKILKADVEDDVYYMKNPDSVIRETNKRKNRLGLFLAPIKAEEIIEAALNNERMPRKTTYFYPKLYSGLVINKMNRP